MGTGARGMAALGSTATIAGAIALARIKAAQAQEGGGSGIVELPQELWNLLISIAQSLDNIDIDTDKVINALEGSSINFQGWPPNADSVQTIRVICPVANRAYQLPDMPIPEGFSLVIAAWPLNVNLIYIGEDQAAATNANRVDALAAGGLRTLAIYNAKLIWVSALAAGDSVTLISEKRKAT